MLYNNNYLTKNKNILNNQNYIINKRIKSNLIYNIYFDDNLLWLKYFISRFIYYFSNIKSKFIVFFFLHIFIFILCVWFFLFWFSFWLVMIYFIIYFSLSKKLVNFYNNFNNIKVTILWFRRNLWNLYESKLISSKDIDIIILNNNLKNLQISIFYSFLVNWIIYLIYIFIIK